MNLLNIIVLIVYLFIVTFLGFLGYKSTKTSQDYLLAGRKTHPFIMAMSYGATFISTSAIVGFGGLAANLGMGLLWLTFLNVFVGVFIAFVVFGKRTRKIGHTLDAHTFPELIGKRFNSKFIQGYAAALIFLFMPIYAAAVLKGGANFIETYFGISYSVALLFFVAIVAIYVWMGGLKGVMYTDAFQGSIMFVAVVALLIVAYSKLGGVTSAHQQLTDLFQNPDVQESVSKSIAGGFQGWTSMPKFGSPIWWTMVSTLFAGIGIGALAQPQLIVRFMTVRSNRELNRAVLSGGVFILATTGVMYLVGSLANVLLYNSTGNIAIVAAGGVNDNIVPLFIKTYLPEWFSVIFLITMLAAAMSTISSQFHTMGTAAGRDLYEKTFGRSGNTTVVTKVGMLIVIIISTLLAFLASSLPVADGIIAKFTTIFFELMTAAFLPTYFGALYLKKMPRAAAKASMLAGSISWLIWSFFVHANASYFQLSNLIFGKTSIVLDTPFEALSKIGTTFIALPISILAAVIVGIVYTAKKKTDLDESYVQQCFQGVKSLKK